VGRFRPEAGAEPSSEREKTVGAGAERWAGRVAAADEGVPSRVREKAVGDGLRGVTVCPTVTKPVGSTLRR
jgi:hypothetical protein